MADEDWSREGFLEGLRTQSDPLADACIGELAPFLDKQDFGDVFRAMAGNGSPVPPGTPLPLARFLAEARRLPRIDGQPADLARIARGQEVFLKNLLPSCAVLQLKSLLEGYAAPRLSTVLARTGNLESRTYHRLSGVLQLLVNVSQPGGFSASGKGLATLAKLRLIHASIRRFVERQDPGYSATYGQPLNCEDMLATLMAFSLLVLRGLKRLGIAVAPGDAEDFYYLWRIAGMAMGIHPPGQPESAACLPPDLASASLFYDGYCRRNYVPAQENPAGVSLARADLAMARRFCRSFFGRHVVLPLLAEQLIDREGMVRVGLRPPRASWLMRSVAVSLPAIWSTLWRRLDGLDATGSIHATLSTRLFDRVILMERGGEVTFLLPDTLEEFAAL